MIPCVPLSLYTRKCGAAGVARARISRACLSRPLKSLAGAELVKGSRVRSAAKIRLGRIENFILVLRFGGRVVG